MRARVSHTLQQSEGLYLVDLSTDEDIRNHHADAGYDYVDDLAR